MGNKWVFKKINKLSYDNNVNKIQLEFLTENSSKINVTFPIDTKKDNPDILYSEFSRDISDSVINDDVLYRALGIYCKPNPRWISIKYC